MRAYPPTSIADSFRLQTVRLRELGAQDGVLVGKIPTGCTRSDRIHAVLGTRDPDTGMDRT